jgi:hypothetical protein
VNLVLSDNGKNVKEAQAFASGKIIGSAICQYKQGGILEQN